MLNSAWVTSLLFVCAMSGAQEDGWLRSFDSSVESVVDESAGMQKIASGFAFTEGPVWFTRMAALLFSDIPNNVIYEWTPAGTSIFRKHSGYDANDAAPGAYVGSNGLTIDPQHRLAICEMGDRRVTRLENDGTITVLADRYQGKRLNSPNDLVYRADGTLYFTDPPHGLPKEDSDPRKELKVNGVYLWNNKGLRLVASDLTRPNGLAFSPDEKYLYVGNSDARRKVWVRFDVLPDGSLQNEKVFFDATADTADGPPDGMKVDRKGNLFCTGPGGVWIFSPQAKHLGTIVTPETPANVGWGGPDGKTLFITARHSVYSIKVKTGGKLP